MRWKPILVSLAVVSSLLALSHIKPHKDKPMKATLAAFGPRITQEPRTPSPSPTKRPTPSASARPAVAVHPAPRMIDVAGDCARVVAAWPGDKEWVLRNARRESGCSPTEVGHELHNGHVVYYYGVMQMDIDFWHTYGEGRPGLPIDYSIEVQMYVAWRGYQARGCEPWGCR